MMKFKDKYKRRSFFKGWGLGRIIKLIKHAKEQIILFRGKSEERVLINKLRIEMYQIVKHQKLTMRYLNRLEEIVKPTQLPSKK